MWTRRSAGEYVANTTCHEVIVKRGKNKAWWIHETKYVAEIAPPPIGYGFKRLKDAKAAALKIVMQRQMSGSIDRIKKLQEGVSVDRVKKSQKEAI